MTEPTFFRVWHEHGNGQSHEPPQIYLNLVDPETGECEFCEDERDV